MQPFYQGKIDNFCALYAVLNAMQIMHGISASQARDLFNVILLRVSRDEKIFRDILQHAIDYVAFVDATLQFFSRAYPMVIGAPFPVGTDCATVWNGLREYSRPEKKKTAVFRFIRYAALRSSPMADHWTTAHTMDSEGLRLFDCSLEPKGLYYLSRSAMVDKPGILHQDCFVIPPESVRLLSLD